MFRRVGPEIVIQDIRLFYGREIPPVVSFIIRNPAYNSAIGQSFGGLLKAIPKSLVVAIACWLTLACPLMGQDRIEVTLLGTGNPRPILERFGPSAPPADRFVGHDDASFGKKILNIPEAEAEFVVEPDGMTDDFAWVTVPVIDGSHGFNHASLPVTGSS